MPPQGEEVRWFRPQPTTKPELSAEESQLRMEKAKREMHNIDDEEIGKRYTASYFGIVGSIIVYILSIYFGVSGLTRSIICAPFIMTGAGSFISASCGI
jgi:hypothetical protein